ncbi:MAG TPA: hypothetical protein VFY29_14885 [Terriglobia bacterium]|nr:hypothetical protein [Terriglobia bacterium]
MNTEVIEQPQTTWTESLKLPVRVIDEEIARVEQALREKDGELTNLMADPAVQLGSILEAKRSVAELSAYLRGLQFSQTFCAS